jgi:signal transduction histidine kinase
VNDRDLHQSGRRHLSAQARNALIFYGALALLCLAGLITYLTIVRLLHAEQMVSHTRDVQAIVTRIDAAASRAGRDRTEFLRSGDGASLEDFEAAVTDGQQTIIQVKQLTADNPVQQNYCVRLQSVYEQRIGLTRQLIERKKAGGVDPQTELQMTQSIVGRATEMDGVMRSMQQEEQRLLAQRQAHSQLLFRLAIAFCAVAFVMAIGLLGLHYYLLTRELQARQRAERALRHLSARLLEIQDDERRRISRELHDGLGQYLAAAKMRLETAHRELPGNANLTKSVEIIEQTIAEARTLSHLLHPPLLDEIGFASAATWYVEGFSERSGIQVSLSLPEKLGRLPGSVELTLFRVLQEALTNIHRHSGSRKAEIEVVLRASEVALCVTDHGHGMDSAVLHRFETNEGYLGVGLTGMKERLRELGGRMEVQSDTRGTTITATLPIDHSTLEVKPIVAPARA